MIAMLEHVSRPRAVLEEAFRVLKPSGHAVVVVPNDVNLSLGRVLLRKWPPRYPDHLTFFTPGRLRSMIRQLFVCEYAAPMPFGKITFWLNMYYFAILRKSGSGSASV